MDSSELSLILKGISDRHLLYRVYCKTGATRPGVYVIPMAGDRHFGRLHGESDILYIGSTETKGLTQRLRQCLDPNWKWPEV